MNAGKILFFYTFLVVVLFNCLAACTNYKKNSTHKNVADTQISGGIELAASYCQSCHLLPEPGMLDSKSWDIGVLPAMGPRLGIFNFDTMMYPSNRYDPLIDSGFYPKYPVMRYDQWKKIIDYYTSVSPDSLEKQQRNHPVVEDKSLFSPVVPPKPPYEATTTLVKFDTAIQPTQLFVSQVAGRRMYRYDQAFVIRDSFEGRSPIVDIEVRSDTIFSSDIGTIKPNNGKDGTISLIRVAGGSKMNPDSNFLIEGLRRPVQVVTGDLNQDGKPDLLVCELGNLTGALSWMENLGSNKYRRHILRNAPGVIKVYLDDVNKDGLPDVWALFSQGEEGIFLFTNKGNGSFDSLQLLRFQPVYGSSSFEFADFNKDGYKDILYTCGDKADFSPVLKPYHGVYIFLNDGSNHFKQQYFFPIYGCFKAVARDFDGDGDLDIAAISFFADYENHPEESFLYLKNSGNLDFYPYRIPGTSAGRWLTMDAADWDGDGRIDLVLGNFSIAPAPEKYSKEWKSGAPFIILKNIMAK